MMHSREALALPHCTAASCRLNNQFVADVDFAFATNSFGLLESNTMLVSLPVRDGGGSKTQERCGPETGAERSAPTGFGCRLRGGLVEKIFPGLPRLCVVCIELFAAVDLLHDVQGEVGI